MKQLPNTRITVPMTSEEKTALQTWATQECRGTREQLRYVLRSALQQRGLLPQQTATPVATNQVSAIDGGM